LKKLKPKDRQKIVQSLAARVPPPTKQQLKRQQLQALQQSLQARLGVGAANRAMERSVNFIRGMLPPIRFYASARTDKHPGLPA
jgi:hypothetical protein